MACSQKQATDAVKADAWGNTQLTNALMQSEAERDQLRAQVERLQGGEPVAWRVRRHDAPKYWIVFLHKPVDALQDPDREVQPLYTAQPAAPAMVPWQPIATAPKDGTKILAYIHIDDGDIGVMKWMDFGQGLAVWVWADELMGDVDPDPYQPTHWMPLPPPPVGIGQPAGGEG